jgi:hypothetical protein
MGGEGTVWFGCCWIDSGIGGKGERRRLRRVCVCGVCAWAALVGWVWVIRLGATEEIAWWTLGSGLARVVLLGNFGAVPSPFLERPVVRGRLAAHDSNPDQRLFSSKLRGF